MAEQERSRVRLVAIALDAAAPADLAAFWARALRWDVAERANGVELVPTDATTISVILQPCRTASSPPAARPSDRPGGNTT